jgi:hypothetical protein
MTAIGYAHLISLLKLPVNLAGKPATVAPSVNRRVDTENSVLFPSSVALTDTPLGHLEFALRHEGIDLPVIEAVFDHIEPGELVGRLRESPNGEYIRRAAFLWEWFKGDELQVDVNPSGRYIDLFPSDRYVTARNPVRHPKYRVADNALGDRRFCPVVSSDAYPGPAFLEGLLERAASLSAQSEVGGLYERAIHYLYLSETRGSFAIERETPSASKEERFVQILRQAGDIKGLNEERLVAIQNAVVRDVYSREASYRTHQNWLENHAGRITFFPHPVEGLRETMAGWEAFVNEDERGIDPLIRAACAAFGFVYLHPFMDGNGRLHRFVIHHVLAHSGLVSPDMVIPVSAVIMKHIPTYHQVLSAFSEPVTRLWDYLRHDDGPQILNAPGCAPYRYFQADQEVGFLGQMFQEAVEQEIPRELGFLRGYDAAVAAIDAEFDLPQKEIALLVRMIQGNQGRLSKKKRPQFDRLPDEVISRIEQLVADAFGGA